MSEDMVDGAGTIVVASIVVCCACFFIYPGLKVLKPQEASSKKISLKSMTLSNGRQKINDCLGIR